MDIAQLLAEKGLNVSREDVMEILRDYDFSDIEDFKADSIRLLVFYLKIVLNDNLVSEDELRFVKFFKLLFGIKEGDIIKNSQLALEVAGIINNQSEVIYVDNIVTEFEAMHKVNLQEIFGLNYDEFLKLSNMSALKSMDRGADWIEIDTYISVEEFYNWMQEKNTDLDSPETSSQGRHIPQNVKDDVWNRDGGKCVLCGSNENLEFDHIIPHSKGGANTYRNVQLLCESCNRQKSDNIG